MNVSFDKLSTTKKQKQMLHNTGTAEATMMDYSLGQSNTSKKLKENSNKILRGANRKETKK